jgi:integrase
LVLTSRNRPRPSFNQTWRPCGKRLLDNNINRAVAINVYRRYRNSAFAGLESEKGIGARAESAVDFRSFRTMHSSLMLREGARLEVVRDNMGHANIDVTQNVYGKSWWEERVDAVTRAVEAVSAATENAQKAEAKQDQPETFSDQWVPLWVPQQEAKIASC